MRAGQLTQSIKINRYIATSDDAGQQLKTYSLLSEQRAEVKDLSSDETVSSGRYEGKDIYQFTIRHADIVKKDQIEWRGLTYEIISIINPAPNNRNNYLVVKAFSNG